MSRPSDFGEYQREDDRKPKGRTKPKGKRRALKVLLIILLCLVIILAGIVAAFFIMSAEGKKQLKSKGDGISTPADIAENVEDDGSVVDYNGKRYVLDNDVVSLVFLGIDKESVYEGNDYGSSGQADAILVGCLNTKTGKIKVIPISRETMVDINSYSKQGAYGGTERKQICLAYAYGNTPEKSAENVMISISRVLYGMDLGSYITIDLSGIGNLNDMIGGVNLTPADTIDSAGIIAGKNITLTGNQATAFVRSRGQDLDANNRRMLRQKQYMNAFISQAGNNIVSDFTKIGTYYNKSKPYVSTDLSLSAVTFLARTFLTANVGGEMEYISVKGEMRMGEFAEFEPDPTSLYEAVLSCFYKEEG